MLSKSHSQLSRWRSLLSASAGPASAGPASAGPASAGFASAGFAVAFAVLFSVSSANSEPAPTDPDAVAESDTSAEVIVVKPRPSDRADARNSEALEESSFVTRIDTAELSPSATLTDAIGNSVGAEVRSVGGLGGFSSISVRGLGAGHTPVMIDNVPLAQIATVTADLSLFDVHSFESAHLYRSVAPSSVGLSGMAGALNLISAVGAHDAKTPALVSVGVGSFGARHLRGRVLGSTTNELDYQLGLGYAGANGDFSFFDDNGTNLNANDDKRSIRTNNGYDRVDAVVRAREVSGTSVRRGGARLILKRQGLPGIGTRQTEFSTLSSSTGVLDVSVSNPSTTLVRRGLAVVGTQVTTFLMFDRQVVNDSRNEVGIGNGNSESETFSGGGSASANARAASGRWQITAAVDSRLERFEMTGMSQQRGHRLNLGLRTSGRLALGRSVWLEPSFAVGGNRTEAMEGHGRADLDVSPRLAGAFRLHRDVTIKAGTGYATRQPTIVELFGDRGFLAGNPELGGEGGPTADAGFFFAPLGLHRGIDRVFLEAAVFWSRPDNAIVYFPTTAGFARPINLEGADNRGLELSVSSRFFALASVQANYTFLDARQRSLTSSDGKALPNRSRHQAFAELALETDRFRVFANASLASGNFTDQANLVELPARRFVGMGVDITLTSVFSFALEGKNLTNNTVEMITLDPAPRPDLAQVPRAVSDFFGYPLPGRSFYATAQARF